MSVVMHEKRAGEEKGLVGGLGLLVQYMDDGAAVSLTEGGETFRRFAGANPREAVESLKAELQPEVEALMAMKELVKDQIPFASWRDGEITYPRDVSNPQYRLVCSNPGRGEQATAQVFREQIVLFTARPAADFKTVGDQLIRFLNSHRDQLAKLVEVAKGIVTEPW